MPKGLESSSGFEPCPSTQALRRGGSASGMSCVGFQESPSSFRRSGWYRNGELPCCSWMGRASREMDGCEQLQEGFEQATREHTREVPEVYTGRTRRPFLQPLFGPSSCA